MLERHGLKVDEEELKRQMESKDLRQPEEDAGKESEKGGGGGGGGGGGEGGGGKIWGMVGWIKEAVVYICGVCRGGGERVWGWMWLVKNAVMSVLKGGIMAKKPFNKKPSDKSSDKEPSDKEPSNNTSHKKPIFFPHVPGGGERAPVKVRRPQKRAATPIHKQ